MQIDVWSDYICPWCALGLARLQVALREFEHADEITLVHRSFELYRGAPERRPGSMEEIVGRKYGLSPDRVRAGHAQLTALGAQVGFDFAFERVRLGSTFDAHRLSQAVRGTAWEPALVERLFAASFSEGRQLSDDAVLRDVARGAGLPDAITDNVLGSAAYGDEVRSDEAAAEQLDVTGVPYFLIGGAWPIPGAQDVETLGIVLRRAWSRFGH
jgi:predicted DsbA family dithiol-disulfide isomerase